MSDGFELLLRRREYAKRRLDDLRSRIVEFEVLRELPGLCIYVTGSFGRLEASEHSDLDLFFIHEGASDVHLIPRIEKILLDADLIRAVRKLQFPEFSNDGEYLSVHYIEDIKKTLGGRHDDFKNHFTARLLLLLESRPLHNEKVYYDALLQIVSSYYRDYHGHETSFRPIFLINDIMRFWRTLCLNYEHRRTLPEDDEKRRNKSHLVNLKLKFSRLLTCHSAIAMLSINRHVLEPGELQHIISLSPLERLDEIAKTKPTTGECVDAMKKTYSWFLDRTGRKESEVLGWIADPCNRKAAFGKGRWFADQMYEILCRVTEGSDTMRFLVV